MDRVHSIEIGEPIDWAFARFLVDTGAIDLTPWRDGDMHSAVTIDRLKTYAPPKIRKWHLATSR